MVSVIIPNYNHAKFLTQRIESILCQTYQDFEVIILDDCSTDNSREVIEQFRDHPKVSTILLNEENSGSTFKQWDKGISIARGDWIWIAESDDWCEANFLEVIMDGLLKNTNCVIGYCHSYCIVGENQIKWHSLHNKLMEYSRGNEFVVENMILSNAIYNASKVVWKKEKYALISKEFTGFRFCGDWLFWIELALHGDVMICGRLMNYFRKHESDITGMALRTGLASLEELKLGAYLMDKRIIDFDTHCSFVKSRYLKFKERAPEMDEKEAFRISKLFLSDDRIKRLERPKHPIFRLKKYLRRLFP